MDLDDLGGLADKARDLADQAGGLDAITGHLDELKDVIEGDGSVVDKAKGAFDALSGNDG